MFLKEMAIHVLLLCLAVFHSTFSADLLSEYAHHVVLDAEEKMKLFWTVDWDAESVSFAVEAETTGWVGFGFSTGSGQMVGSDVVIGWVKDNKGYLTDRYADAESVPPVDKQQDYELTGFQESGGKTLLKFKRKFDTCDTRDRKLEKGATKVIFAYHTEDPISPTEAVKQHVFRGAKSILLLEKIDRRTINEDGWKELVMTARNEWSPGGESDCALDYGIGKTPNLAVCGPVFLGKFNETVLKFEMKMTIPSKETTYWCTLLRGPKLNSKHHITKVEPYIQKGNEGFVHHFVIYECDGNFTEDDFNEGLDCHYSANMPYRRCQQADLIAAWAVGGQAIYFPSHVGLPLGGEGSPTNFLLEMHYDNPQNIAGRQDSSGARIFYTDKLRQYDAGVVSIGLDVNSWHIVPPKQNNWISAGYCMHQCTESAFKSTVLPGGGINVFSAFLHTHLAGRAVWTKHIRKGKELPDIARNDNYDFNFQDSQSLRDEVHIEPGDDLIQYCKYDSMDRDKPIKGGPSTRDEMCSDFMVYYPRITGFTTCENTIFEPSLKILDKYFENVNVTNVWINPLAYMNIDWTNAMVADLKKYESDTKTVIPGCWLKNLTTVADIKNSDLNVPVPKITDPLPPPEKTSCFTVVSSGPVSQIHAALALLWISCVVISVQ